jgi:hypothetical protein
MTDDLFADCASADEIMFVVFDQEGPGGFAAFLTGLIDRHLMDSKSLTEAAIKLQDAGLTEASAMVLEAARHAPEICLAAKCPYPREDTISPIHREVWMEGHCRGFGPADFSYLRKYDPDMFSCLPRHIR